MGNKIFDINGATIRLKNKGTIRFVNQGCRDFRWRREDDWNPRDKFWFSPLLMQSAWCILCRRLNSPRRSGFGTLPWHRGSDVPSSPFLFPLSLSLPFFFFFPYILSLIYRAYPNRANVIYTAHCARRIAKAVFEVTATRIHLLNQATARNLNPIV